MMIRAILWTILLGLALPLRAFSQLTDIEKATEAAFEPSFLKPLESINTKLSISECFVGSNLEKCGLTADKKTILLDNPISAAPPHAVLIVRPKDTPNITFLPAYDGRWAPAREIQDGARTLEELTGLANKLKVTDCDYKGVCNIIVRSRPRNDGGVVFLRCRIAALDGLLGFARDCHPAAIESKGEWWLPVLTRFEFPRGFSLADLVGVQIGSIPRPPFTDVDKVLMAVDRALQAPQFGFSTRKLRGQSFLALNEGRYSTLIEGGWYVSPEVHIYVDQAAIDIDCSIRLSKYKSNSVYSWHAAVESQERAYCNKLTEVIVSELKNACPANLKASLIGSDKVVCR
jgi:hypothetical protein